MQVYFIKIMDDWEIKCSDDENEDGFYEPDDPKVIISLYESIQKNEIPEFRATIYPRKEPNSETQEMEVSAEKIEESQKTPEKHSEEVTEFDFDTQPEDNVKRFTPRRTPNRPSVKKVAKMSNVFSDIMKYKKMDEEQNKETSEPQAN